MPKRLKIILKCGIRIHCFKLNLVLLIFLEMGFIKYRTFHPLLILELHKTMNLPKDEDKSLNTR